MWRYLVPVLSSFVVHQLADKALNPHRSDLSIPHTNMDFDSYIHHHLKQLHSKIHNVDEIAFLRLWKQVDRLLHISKTCGADEDPKKIVDTIILLRKIKDCMLRIKVVCQECMDPKSYISAECDMKLVLEQVKKHIQIIMMSAERQTT